jgi:hypothetical protein
MTRLGYQIPNFTYPDTRPDEIFDSVVAQARAAEAAGYDRVMVMDRLIPAARRLLTPGVERAGRRGGYAARPTAQRGQDMKRRTSIQRGALLAGLVAVLAGASACAGTPEVFVESPPSAPEFSHISDEQLTSAMWQLAAGIRSLDTILGRQQVVTQSQRLEVLRILDQMMAAADELGPGGVASDHARLTNHLGRFREKLVIARASVALEPPRYYLVGSLSGTCLACHAGP